MYFHNSSKKHEATQVDKGICSDCRYISSLTSELPEHVRFGEESYWLMFSLSLAQKSPAESSFRQSSSFPLVAGAESDCCKPSLKPTEPEEEML